MQVKITIMTSARSPRCRKGNYWYRLESGNHHKEGTGSVENTTKNRLELTCLIEALKRMTRPSQITIRTTSGYLKTGHDNLQVWKEGNWKRNGGKEIKNKDLWKQIEDLETPHQIEIEVLKSG